MARARLNEIHEGLIEKFKQWRDGQARRSRGKGKLAAGSVNRELATLRKALRLAYSYQLISRVPVIRMLPGEVTRDFVLDGATETRYLAAARYPLREAAILMIDLGLRPEELVRAQKTEISLAEKTFTVREGEGAKTGFRVLPLPRRSIEVLQFLFELWPDSPWIFPGQRKVKHLTVWALDNLHAKLKAKANTVAAMHRADAKTMSAGAMPTDTQFKKEFVLYSLRHTFGTRLAESGASPWEIKKLMGHSSVKTSEKYIHPGSESVELAMRRKEAFDRMVRGEAEAQAHSETSDKEEFKD